VTGNYEAFLFAYFANGRGADAEQVRFAVSAGSDPREWTLLRGGDPILVPDVGEGGARDPFLVRDVRTGRFHLLATDLRAVPDDDWDRAVRRGSRGILIWHSDDLVSWTGPSLVTVAPENAGNAWAPKAVWSEGWQTWLVFFASALYGDASMAIDDVVVASAAALPQPLLRSLDAIHLATALRLEPELTAFVTYDKRLLECARAAGFPTASPGQDPNSENAAAPRSRMGWWSRGSSVGAGAA